jgi:hypothetical protein
MSALCKWNRTSGSSIARSLERDTCGGANCTIASNLTRLHLVFNHRVRNNDTRWRLGAWEIQQDKSIVGAQRILPTHPGRGGNLARDY